MRSKLLWRLVPGAALILMSGPGMALTLGRAQGAVLIGRPLDVTVPVVLDTDADAADLCPRAEVQYGDTSVEARPVELQSWSGSAGSLRVRVPRPVDEAFVTVQLRVGCRQSLTRRYVMLTEEPVQAARAPAQPEPVAPQVLPAATALPVAPPPAPAPAPIAAAAPAAKPAPVRRAPARQVASTRPAVPHKRRVVAAPAAPVPAPAQAPRVERPRLKLEAAEVRPVPPAASAAPTPPALRASPTLQASPKPQASANATPPVDVPAPTDPLSSQPDDLLRSAQRLAAFEADMRAMREGLARNQALMGELRARLDEAERERYANGLVYALAALLAAACGLAAVFWHRGRRAQQAWWAERTASSELVLHEHPAPAAPAAPQVAARAELPDPMPAAVPPARELAARDFVAEAGPDSMPAELVAREAAAEASAAPAPLQAPPSVAGSLFKSAGAAASLAETPAVAAPTAHRAVDDAGAVSADELSDLQQQADFFVSLGEDERAIGVLRAHVDAYPEASTVAWLELLDIHHRLGRREDYERLRAEFRSTFQVDAPAFDSHAASRTVGLEAHAALLARVQSSWNSPAARKLVDDAVRQRPQDASDAAMDLECCRDLLLLHGIAAELEQSTSTLGDLRASLSVPLDLDSLTLDAHPNDDWRKLAAPDSKPAGLDIDLGVLEAPPAAATQATPQEHVLDFDFDLNEEFKLPGKR